MDSSAIQSWQGSLVQIIAHADDDLFFMNPDVRLAIAADNSVVTVVLTAAEGDGRNIDTDVPDRLNRAPDYGGYSAARRNGLCGAYARMATGDRNSLWRRQAIMLADDLVVEHNVLEANPRVQLYFFNLGRHPAGSEIRPHPATLFKLWRGTASMMTTVNLPGSPVRGPFEFKREQVLSGLVDLLARHEPTVVRSMDPHPEHDHGKKEYVSSDHADHTAVAQFTIEATRIYTEKYSRQPVMEYYRAYANRYWPYNLSAVAHLKKRQYLLTYAAADGVKEPEMNGDRQLGDEPYRSTHIFSTAYRYTPASNWLTRRSDGSLAAFAVLGGKLACWNEVEPGAGRWIGPQIVGDEWLMPAIAVAAGVDGVVHVVGLRQRSIVSDGVTVDVVHTQQDEHTRLFTQWTSLGGPNWTQIEMWRRREVGVPVAVVDGAGRIAVFVRNYGLGMSMCSQRGDRSWGGWEDLGGSRLQDAPTAIATADGRIEVYAANKNSTYRWHQAEPNGEILMDSSLATTPVASGGISAAEISPNKIALYYRQSHTATVLEYSQILGGWAVSPTVLGGMGGTGPVAVLSRDNESATMLAKRGDGGMVATAVHTRAESRMPDWKNLGGLAVHAPAMAGDLIGRAVIAAIGVDGRLHVARQESADLTSPFGPWANL